MTTLEDALRDNEVLRAHITLLKNDIAKKDNACVTRNAEIAKLVNEAEVISGCLKAANDKIKEKDAEIARLKGALDSQRAAITRLATDRDAAEAEIARLKDELRVARDVADDDSEAARHERNAALDRARKAEAEVANLRNAVEYLQRDRSCSEKEATIAELRKIADAQTERIADLEAAAERLGRELSAHKRVDKEIEWHRLKSNDMTAKFLEQESLRIRADNTNAMLRDIINKMATMIKMAQNEGLLPKGKE